MSFEQLRGFLADHSQYQDLVPRALQAVELYASIAETGHYRLAAAAEIGPDQVTKVLLAAFGKPIGTVIFISLRQPEPDLADGQGRLDGRKLWQDVCFTLWDHLHSGHHLTLWESFPKGRRQLGNRLWELLDEAIGRRIKDVVMASLPSDIGYDLRTACQNHVWHALFYYVAMVMNGVTSRHERLAGLVELLTRSMPLGEKRGMPGTWYVLAA